MRIEAVNTRLARLPIQGVPWGDTFHHVTHIEYCITEVKTDNGLSGVGFSHTSGVGGSTIKHLIDVELGPHLVGSIVAPRPVWHKGWNFLRDLGGGGFTTMALAGVDIALWDIVAKDARKSLIEYLGQSRGRIQAYASGINLNKPLPELLDQVRNWKRKGYTAFKIKVGRPDIEEDIERLTEVRKIIGGLPLMVDANQQMTVKQAIRIGRMMEDLNLTWFEEPVICHDHQGEAQIAAALDTPIASGETVYTHRGILGMLEARSADVLMPDLQRMGGPSEFLKAGHLCEAFHIPCASHLFPEMSLSLLAALPGGYYLEHMPWFEPIYRERIELDADGHAVVPDRPGWGFSFDPDAIRRFGA